MLTRWGRTLDPAHPLPEYPRPQLVREGWTNLNGIWEHAFTATADRPARWAGPIVVPFSPEAPLSGVNRQLRPDQWLWYRRSFTAPAPPPGGRLLLHFGAVDQSCTVWVDGREAGSHTGGYLPFTLDLTDVLSGAADTAVDHVLEVRVRDLTETGVHARGKQRLDRGTIWYTAQSGIWQTVWLEPVPAVHLRRPRITPDLASSAFDVVVPLSANRRGHTVTVTVTDADGEVATATARADLDLAPALRAVVPADRVRTWGPGDPHLYGVDIELRDADGVVVDSVRSYAGLRSVSIDGQGVRINGETVFQRLVLDQGYWPESLMTAPSDAALARDIELGLAAGFNGARLHQKVFEERYLFHADRLGYLVWGEFGDWGVSGYGTPADGQRPTTSFVAEWMEALQRDHSHPSIIGWCPLNETHQDLHDRITQLDDVTRAMWLATKVADPSRPVLDASGYSHRVLETDVWDSHLYEQQPEKFAELVGGLADGQPYENARDNGTTMSVPYRGQPYFVSEYGGIWWNPDVAATASGSSPDSWGYGQRVADEEEFHARFRGLTDALLGDPRMFAYCYTQLTDVFQEENGIYRFDRSEKLDVARVREVQVQVAAVEAAENAAASAGRGA
jgi:beta-galactosidase/beta-glucuronidase